MLMFFWQLLGATAGAFLLFGTYCMWRRFAHNTGCNVTLAILAKLTEYKYKTVRGAQQALSMVMYATAGVWVLYLLLVLYLISSPDFSRAGNEEQIIADASVPESGTTTRKYSGYVHVTVDGRMMGNRHGHQSDAFHVHAGQLGTRGLHLSFNGDPRPSKEGQDILEYTLYVDDMGYVDDKFLDERRPSEDLGRGRGGDEYSFVINVGEKARTLTLGTGDETPWDNKGKFTITLIPVEKTVRAWVGVFTGPFAFGVISTLLFVAYLFKAEQRLVCPHCSHAIPLSTSWTCPFCSKKNSPGQAWSLISFVRKCGSCAHEPSGFICTACSKPFYFGDWDSPKTCAVAAGMKERPQVGVVSAVAENALIQEIEKSIDSAQGAEFAKKQALKKLREKVDGGEIPEEDHDKWAETITERYNRVKSEFLTGRKKRK